MPYFRWIGTDIVGVTKKGKQAAHSQQELSDQLFVRGIALLNCTLIYKPSFLWPISTQAKGDVFRYIAGLLKAGILLPEVLEIAAQQSNNPFLYDMLFAIGTDIKSGEPFSVAIDKQKKIIDQIVILMLIAGYESGRLAHAAENAALYYKTQHFFIKNIRSVLAMPILTFLFFIGISSFIFIFIIPRFADMFFSLNHNLPTITQYMISISEFIRSWSMVFVIGIVALVITGFWHYFTHGGKNAGSIILMKMPFVGTLICQHQYGQVLYALSLLISSGIPVAPALEGVIGCIDNVVIKKRFNVLLIELLSGRMLSDAMITSAVFLPEACALTRIGEKSGTLGQSLESAAQAYSDTMQQSMQKFVFFLQPAVIILLGFLITALIFAVYLPIMQLSHAL